MFYALKLYLSDRWIFFPGLATAAIVLAIWTFTALNVQPTGDSIFLHYNVVFGADLIGSWKRAYVPPAVALGIFFINGLLSFLFYSTNRLVGRLLASMALGVAASILVGQVLMLNLNL